MTVKKILFSSVCALALCGTSVFAVEGTVSSSISSIISVTEAAPTPNKPTDWNELATKATTAKTEAKSAFDGLNLTKYTPYTQALGSLGKADDASSGSSAYAKLNKAKEELNKANAINETLKTLVDKKLITLADGNADLAKSWADYYAEDKAKAEIDAILKKYKIESTVLETALIDGTTAKKYADIVKANELTNEGKTGKQDEVAKAQEGVTKAQGEVVTAEKALKEEIEGKKGALEVALAYKQAIENEIALKNADTQAKAVEKAKQDIGTHQGTIETKKGELGSKDDKADASGKLYAVMKDKANTLIGDYNKATAPADLSAVKSLNEVVKYYEDEKKGNDAEKAKAVKAIIAKVEKGEKVDFSTELKDVTFSGTVATDYTSAQGNVKDAEDALAKAIKDLAQAQKDLTTAEAKLQQAVLATPVAKEKAEKVKKSLGELYTVSGKSGEKFVALLAMQNVDDVTKLDKVADKELIEQIKAVANEVAQEVVNNKKEEISSNALTSLAIQLNNMNKRLGEVRGMGGDTGVWTRVYGGKYSTDYDKFNYYSAQIGADKKSALKDGDLILGILAGYDKVNADIKTDAYSFGIYGSYIHNSGFFADSVMKFVSTSHDKSGWDIANQKSFLASFEGGYRFDASESFYVEPSLEFITGHVSEYSAKQAKTTTTVESFSPVIFKPQTFIGVNLDDLAFRFGGGYVLNAKKQEANIMIEDIVAGVNASASTKLEKNNHGFVSLGTSYKIGDNLRLNLSAERTFGGELQKDYEINTTVRYSF